VRTAAGMPTKVCGKNSLHLVQHLLYVITLWVLSAENQANSLLTIECYLKRRNYNTRRDHTHRCSTLLYNSEFRIQVLGG